MGVTEIKKVLHGVFQPLHMPAQQLQICLGRPTISGFCLESLELCGSLGGWDWRLKIFLFQVQGRAAGLQVLTSVLKVQELKLIRRLEELLQNFVQHREACWRQYLTSWT